MLDIPNIQSASPDRLAAIQAKYPPQTEKPSNESFRKEPTEIEALQNYLNKFTSFRHSYINDLPANILKPGDTNYERYKCRGAWWTIISGNIQNAQKEGLFKDAHILQEVQNFLDYVKAVQAQRSKQMKSDIEYRYTREDIEGADAFLDTFIAYFSKRAVEAGAEKAPPAIA